MRRQMPCKNITACGSSWYAYLLDSRPDQISLVTYHTLPSLHVCVWLVNTLTSTAPIGSPIIPMWSPVDIYEQWERNLSFGSADVSGAGTRDELLRTCAWEANADEDCAIWSRATRLKSETLRLEFIFSKVWLPWSRMRIPFPVCFFVSIIPLIMHCFSIMNSQGTQGLGQMCLEHMIVGNISRSDTQHNLFPKSKSWGILVL